MKQGDAAVKRPTLTSCTVQLLWTYEPTLQTRLGRRNSPPARARSSRQRHHAGPGYQRTNIIMKRSHKAEWIFSILALVGTGLSETPPKPAMPEPKVQSVLLSLPLSFEANRGQTDPAVKFFSQI